MRRKAAEEWYEAINLADLLRVTDRGGLHLNHFSPLPPLPRSGGLQHQGPSLPCSKRCYFGRAMVFFGLSQAHLCGLARFMALQRLTC